MNKMSKERIALSGIIGLMSLADAMREANGIGEVLDCQDCSETVEIKRPSKYPLTNIGLAEEGEMVVQIAIPGMSKEDIKVEIQGDMLRVIGSVNVCPNGQAIQFDQMDIVLKDFVREVQLHEDFIGGEIECSVANGILTISIDEYQEPIYSIEVK